MATTSQEVQGVHVLAVELADVVGNVDQIERDCLLRVAL
jgi:hypothetical protein